MNFNFKLKLFPSGILIIVLLATTFTSKAQDYELGFKARSEVLIDKIADQYTPPSVNIGDPEKYYFPKAMARIEKYGPNDSIGNAIIHAFQNNPPFHFTLVGLARIMSKYPDIEKVKDTKLKYLKQVWKRNDSYNAWTAEGTENHVNMSRTSGYLFAMHSLTYPEFKQSESKMSEMKDWMHKWAKTVYTMGTAEWNSSIYEPYNFIGWLNVYDFSQDPEVKMTAKAVLDFYTTNMALHYMQGAIGGPEMRGGGVNGQINSTDEYFAWLWFGEDDLNKSYRFGPGSEYIQAIHAITSTYRPSKEIVALARKKEIKNEYYWNSSPSYLYETPSFIRKNILIDQNYILGTAYVPYGGYLGSSYQVVNWKLAARSNRNPIPYIVTGNGTYHQESNGKTRDPYTQWAQHKNVLIQLTRLPVNYKEIDKKISAIVKKWGEEWKKDFKSRFPNDAYKLEQMAIKMPIIPKERLNTSYMSFPRIADYNFMGNILYLNFEHIIVKITGINQKLNPKILYNEKVEKGEKQTTDKSYVLDSAGLGKITGFVLEILPATQYKSFGDCIAKTSNLQQLDTNGLQSNLKLSYKSSQNDLIEVQYTSSGSYTEAIVDWGYGVKQPVSFFSAPPFKQPEWPQGEGFGRMASWKVNGQDIDLKKNWDVYDGLRVSLHKQVLEVKSPDSFYKVDFSGNTPVFTTR